MKTKWKLLLLCIALPLLVGGASALVTKDSMASFATLNQPPLSPPGWLFPVVWTVLFVLMGLASYLYITQMPTKEGLFLYGLQLVFNFFWSIFFFNLQWYTFSFLWLVVLGLLILATMIQFYKASHLAAWLLIPYLAWVIFAGYLNLGIAILN